MGGGGVGLKKLNYPISMLPIVFRSVDRKVNDHLNNTCLSCKKTFIKRNNELLITMYETKNLQII